VFAGVFKSTNGGAEWSRFSVGTDTATVNLIAVDPKVSDTLYAATDKGILKTTNGGKNWNPKNNGLPQDSVNYLIIHPGKPITLFAGTPSGVFRSSDGGENWSSLNTGLSCKDVRNLAFDRLTPETIYAGTNGGGVFVFNQIPISLSYPPDGEEIRACSYYDPPRFGWVTDQELRSIEIQFSSNENLSAPSERVTGSVRVNEILIKPSKWKKILLLPSAEGGIVYWKAVGKRVDGTKMESNVFSFSVRGPEPVGNPAVSPTREDSLPVLKWQNNCNTKFKVWFGSDSTFAKKATYPFSIKNPNDPGGGFSKTLTSGQWTAIKRLVRDVIGSTVYWFVESWDDLGRYVKTELATFSLED